MAIMSFENNNSNKTKSFPIGIIIILLCITAFNIYRGITAGLQDFALFAFILSDLLSAASTVSFLLTLVTLYLAHKEESKKKGLIGVALLILCIVLAGIGVFLKYHFGF